MTTKENRVPLKVSPQFLNKLKEIQRNVRMQTGENKSLRDITDDIIKSAMFEDLEKNILKSSNKIDMDIKIKFDRRML